MEEGRGDKPERGESRRKPRGEGVGQEECAGAGSPNRNNPEPSTLNPEP